MAAALQRASRRRTSRRGRRRYERRSHQWLTEGRCGVFTMFWSTCFYITAIGAPETEQRKHSDLFLGSLIEPALQSFGLTVVRADGIDKPARLLQRGEAVDLNRGMADDA